MRVIWFKLKLIVSRLKKEFAIRKDINKTVKEIEFASIHAMVSDLPSVKIPIYRSEEEFYKLNIHRINIKIKHIGRAMVREGKDGEYPCILITFTDVKL